MTFTPGYGETPITGEEAEALLPRVREALGEPIRHLREVALNLREAEQYDWEIDKAQYIALLREFDLHRDAKPLAAFIPVRPLGG